VRVDDVRQIFADLRSRPVLRTIVRPTAMAAEVWAAAAPAGLAVTQRHAHVIDLRGGFDTVWSKRFNSQARRGVRKAERSNLEVESDTSGRLVPVLHELLMVSVDRWAEQKGEPHLIARWRANRRDPLARLQAMVETLGSAAKIWVARVGGRPAAAMLVLTGRNAHYTRGAMDIELAGPVRASFLLQKLAIESACNEGCAYYHMGETGSAENLARFKSHFGAEAYTYPEFRIERLPFTNVENQVRQLIKRMFASMVRSDAAEST